MIYKNNSKYYYFLLVTKYLRHYCKKTRKEQLANK